MLSIPLPVLAGGFLIAWFGLLITWTSHVEAVTETRRQDAVARGEQPPNITGVSNYERAELMEIAHRRLMKTRSERLWTLFIMIGIPLISGTMVLLKL
jgi:hypothetical protein